MAAVGGLGDFLRARRARVTPADVGLPAGTGLRRTPGLRREEVAALAGVSIDYYIRLEQGRETNPSPAVLDALAGALLVDPEERIHLHELVRHPSRPGQARDRPQPATGAEAIRPAIRQLLETLRRLAAYCRHHRSEPARRRRRQSRRPRPRRTGRRAHDAQPRVRRALAALRHPAPPQRAQDFPSPAGRDDHTHQRSPPAERRPANVGLPSRTRQHQPGRAQASRTAGRPGQGLDRRYLHGMCV
jgi:transcriptional regulator with XRE-family HTH domain